MKKDIHIPQVENVQVAIAKDGDKWLVYLINANDYELENVLVASKGYGYIDGEEKKTSLLRHSMQSLYGHTSKIIEHIMPDVFQLTNEYWVTYFHDGVMYDKKFIFKPDAASEENLTMILELALKGVLAE